jgi:hypothetical protein
MMMTNNTRVTIKSHTRNIYTETFISYTTHIFFRIPQEIYTEQFFSQYNRNHNITKFIAYTIQQSFLSRNMLCMYATVLLSWPHKYFVLDLRINKHDNVALTGNLTYLNLNPIGS